MKLFANAALIAAGMTALAPAIASAQAVQSWDVYTDFNGPQWVYGQRTGPGCAGPSAKLLYAYAPNAPSGSGFIGWQGVNTPTIVPLVAKNPGNSQVVYSSAQIPANSVWLHPGATAKTPVCAAVRFKAPMAGKYRIKGFIKSIDTGANSVTGYIFVNNTLVGSPIPLSGPMGSQANFDQVVTLTGMPRNIDFALDDGGSYYNDSTQLSLTITRCPPGNGGPNVC